MLKILHTTIVMAGVGSSSRSTHHDRSWLGILPPGGPCHRENSCQAFPPRPPCDDVETCPWLCICGEVRAAALGGRQSLSQPSLRSDPPSDHSLVGGFSFLSRTKSLQLAPMHKETLFPFIPGVLATGVANQPSCQ